MPIRSSIAGRLTPPFPVTCDARWLMSYSAGLGSDDERHLDGTRPDGLVAHPLFPVAPEWALITSPTADRDDGLTGTERSHGVHAGHDLVLHRRIRADEKVSLTGTTVGVEATRAGARMTQRYDAVDAEGQPVWTTWMLSVLRGVDVDGDDVVPSDRLPAVPTLAGGTTGSRQLEIPRRAAHVYTECARIWNPIHTDVGFARAVGLPEPILHGTATLALGISAALDVLGRHPEEVRRVGGSFRAMVPMPAVLIVDVLGSRSRDGTTEATFRVRTEAGRDAVDGGFLVLVEAASDPACLPAPSPSPAARRGRRSGRARAGGRG
jgi:acyl dehydratase